MSSKRKATDIAAGESKKPKVNGSITSFFGPPKAVSTSEKVTGTTIEKAGADPETKADAKPEKEAESMPPPPAVKWDKEAWVEKLTDDQKELLKLEIETLHESWLKELKDEVCSKDFLDLKRFLKREKEQGKKIFPPLEDVYSWFVLSKLIPNLTLHWAVLINTGQDIHHWIR